MLHSGSHQLFFLHIRTLPLLNLVSRLKTSIQPQGIHLTLGVRVLGCEMLQSLKLSNISAHDFLDGWPLGHQVLEYAWLAFQSIELMFTWNTMWCVDTPVLEGDTPGIFYLIFKMCVVTPNVLILHIFWVKTTNKWRKVSIDAENWQN